MRTLFLITGTSRGIGAALARTLLEAGHTVLGVSRSEPERTLSGDYHQLCFDLAEPDGLERIVSRARELFEAGRFGFICLVNNASATEPVGPVENCDGGAIESHLDIGLLAPVRLTSLFIREFGGEPVRKKVAFISSGVAFTPLPDESIYCAAKAGLHMFSQCVGLEQKDRADGFEIVSIGPGMVDTDMQRAVRSKTSEEFAMADFFRQAHADGKLQDPADVADKIQRILEGRFAQGQYVSVQDV